MRPRPFLRSLLPSVLLPAALGVSLGFWALFRALGVTLDWGVFERLLSL